MDIHQVPYTMLGNQKFHWELFNSAGELVLHVWTASCGNFLAELQACKARLLNPEDHVHRVFCRIDRGDPALKWTLTVEQGAIRVS